MSKVKESKNAIKKTIEKL